MKLSKVMLASIFLTAAILAVIGLLTTNVFASRSPAAGQASPEQVKVYQEREAQYAQLIDQANQQLAKANENLQTMQVQLEQAKKSQPEAAAAQPVHDNAAASVAVSVDKAATIAAEVATAGEKVTKNPELVSFEGKTAYEVAYSNGSIYVDAQTGQVLFNGTIPHEITKEKAGQIAAEYIQYDKILFVDTVTFRGAQLYRVVFKNSTMVYMDKFGQITYILKDSNAPRVTLVDNSGGGGGGNPSGSSHDDDHGGDN
jgi:uncharacterized membrane protein YkoI